MGCLRFCVAFLLAGVTGFSLAQVPGSPDDLKSHRPPQGTARDGSAPAEGAIKGGSLEPDIRTSLEPRRDIARCKELHGKLREECLRDLRKPRDKINNRDPDSRQ